MFSPESMGELVPVISVYKLIHQVINKTVNILNVHNIFSRYDIFPL